MGIFFKKQENWGRKKFDWIMTIMKGMCYALPTPSILSVRYA